MKIVIYGSGGVGGYFGGRIAQAGKHEVVFIARNKNLAAMKENGLVVKSIFGDFTVKPCNCTDDPASVGHADLVVIALKTWQCIAAVDAIKPLVGPNTLILPVQNGVETPQQFATVYGKEKVLAGYCKIISSVGDPGVIEHTGPSDPPHLEFGEMDGSRTDRCLELLEVLRTGEHQKIDCPENILTAMWTKFMFISSYSGIQAVVRGPAGVIFGQQEVKDLVVKAFVEVTEIAKAAGVPLPADVVEQTMGWAVESPAHAISSMARDILNGRPSELDSQNGAVVRFGKKYGIPTPTHELVYTVLLPSERRARGEYEWPEFKI
eukprot:GFYU01005320.1.p1 GENE.GFYU01005320.1~~GFYU01005320.1.p1  ORF type:complete len:321 (-),score=119.38 GFYU01005320.1:25-987(-)